MKLTEYSTFEEFDKASKSALDYGGSNARSDKVRREQRLAGKKRRDYVVRVNTPEHIPVMYIHSFRGGRLFTQAFVVVEGSEGDSYVIPSYNELREDCYLVLHSHAINRYIERSQCQDSLESVTLDILSHATVLELSNDSDTYYINYKQGVFLCKREGFVVHIRTYITDEQCHRNQRLFSIKSKNGTEEFRKTVQGVQRKVLHG